MNEQLFKDMLNVLLNAAEQNRYNAKEAGDSMAADRWSAVAGNLNYARQGLRS